mmetsp:Transcript_104010/g.294191  ORF Transcript_104010/g.294191 Transcript_104010/m.294191 type:complete len:282 (+) Transcript_104010:506-1351(+)
MKTDKVEVARRPAGAAGRDEPRRLLKRFHVVAVVDVWKLELLGPSLQRLCHLVEGADALVELADVLFGVDARKLDRRHVVYDLLDGRARFEAGALLRLGGVRICGDGGPGVRGPGDHPAPRVLALGPRGLAREGEGVHLVVAPVRAIGQGIGHPPAAPMLVARALLALERLRPVDHIGMREEGGAGLGVGVAEPGLDESSHVCHEGRLPSVVEFLDDAEPRMDPEVPAGLPGRRNPGELVWAERQVLTDRLVLTVPWAVHRHDHVEGICAAVQVEDDHGLV